MRGWRWCLRRPDQSCLVLGAISPARTSTSTTTSSQWKGLRSPEGGPGPAGQPNPTKASLHSEPCSGCVGRMTGGVQHLSAGCLAS
eukprot:6430179-Lingulodinium_polyedra.AAC.1